MKQDNWGGGMNEMVTALNLEFRVCVSGLLTVSTMQLLTSKALQSIWS
jgi:hypothetical protein